MHIHYLKPLYFSLVQQKNFVVSLSFFSLFQRKSKQRTISDQNDNNNQNQRIPIIVKKNRNKFKTYYKKMIAPSLLK